ncbi:MAG: zinc-ribbon domain-containing protein [Polyangiaceae bacterium]
MKISCPACAAKYSIADEKVQDKLAKIRCRKCGTTIVIDGKVNPPSVYAGDGGASQVEAPQVSDPGVAPSGGEYSVDFGDNDQRTLSLAEIVAQYNAGTITAETFVWADGMADWQPVGQVPAIVDALHGHAAPAAPAPEPVASAEPPPWEAKPAVESPSGLRAAARSGGGRGSTADLFGAVESAGGESDVTTSAREPAAPAMAGGTGARNESSVLFSLSALTSAAPAPTGGGATAAKAPSGGTKEDSGLIDLKALTAAADAPAAPIAPLAPSPLGMAPPLGLAPPLGGGVEAQIAMPSAQPSKSKAGIFIGAGIAVAAIAIAGAIVVVGKGSPPPPAPTVAAPAPTPTPTPTPTPAPEDTSAAKPPSTGTSEEDKKAPPKKVASGGGVAKPAPGGSPKPGGEKPAATGDKPKPKPASGGCGCAPGDLQCAMKCAAGGG